METYDVFARYYVDVHKGTVTANTINEALIKARELVWCSDRPKGTDGTDYLWVENTETGEDAYFDY